MLLLRLNKTIKKEGSPCLFLLNETTNGRQRGNFGFKMSFSAKGLGRFPKQQAFVSLQAEVALLSDLATFCFENE